ncbi:MAG: enoyl-CoA hydratase/isomerase family protein [Acidobacteria bacterium]|nr:enoyl-CoA hydratase/isomerase family protein [Acidobacteriota bacterium]
MAEQPDAPVLVAEEDGIMTVTLNRPKKLNAINLPMSQALDEATWRFGDTEELRVMVLTANGRYFTAGLDISDEAQAERRDFEGPQPTKTLQRRKYRQRHHELHDEFEKIEKPIIHAAQGPCLGLGLEMGVSCDFRFCAPHTTYGLPEVPNLGVIAGSGGISRLTRLVGPHWSKWIGMAGRNIDADTALRIGLVHEVYPAEEFMDRVYEFARSLVALDADALGMAKLTIDLCTAEDREKSRHIERIANSALNSGPPRPGRLSGALQKGKQA